MCRLECLSCRCRCCPRPAQRTAADLGQADAAADGGVDARRAHDADCARTGEGQRVGTGKGEVIRVAGVQKAQALERHPDVQGDAGGGGRDGTQE